MTDTDFDVIKKQVRFNQMLGGILIYADIHDIDLIINSFIRTAEEQAKQFQIGRRGIIGEKPITPNDGYIKISRHQTKKAIDLQIVDREGQNINEPEKYKFLGEFWKTRGGQWGGDFTPPEIWHFDLI